MRYKETEKVETIVDALFPEKVTGFFLEIGAWDGEHLSQTIHLEHRGWRGLCVDPFPHNFANRSCMLCNEAVSADGKPREFVYVTTDRRDGGDVSYFSGFKDSLKFHWPLIEEHCNYEMTEVDTITILQLYETYHLPQYIDFLSVDVEGAEIEVFSGIDFDVCKFGVIMFEHNSDENVKRHIGALLERHGYRPYLGLYIDDIYVREDLWLVTSNG